MKAWAVACLIGGLAFVFMGYQIGIFDPPEHEEDTSVVVKDDKKSAPQKKKPRFPQDLAPAARALPVPEAAPFNPDDKQYPMVILKANGTLYEPWQERLNEPWGAETIESTQLAVILGGHKKIYVDITRYPNGAPPILRYRWELEVSVVEPRSGRVLANRTFANVPRAIRPREAWELTEIGQPVAFKTVFNWVASNARANFPEPTSLIPVEMTVE